MRRVSLRGRVVLAAAAAIVVAVAGLGFAVAASLQQRLESSLDRSLRARAVDVARLSATTPQLLTQPGALEGRLGGSTLLVQIVDRRGRLVARSSGLGARVLPAEGVARRALDGRRSGYADARLGPDPIRLYAAPLGELGDGPAAGGAVLVAGTTAEIDRTLADVRTFVLAGSAVAVVVGALLALVLTTRALRPLRRLSSGARAIEETGDASRRLPAPSAADEIGQLTAILNAMLGSLERAREAERRFVGDASHELRTPLTALRGNTAHAARHGADPELLADIAADVERLSGLLDDLLALAREDAATAVRGEPVDLAVLAEAAAAADPAGRAVAHGTPGEAVVVAEAPALRRAVDNLVRNARRHGPEGGRIEVTAARAGDRARITVADEGTGLAPAEAQHAFERFWRGSGARGEGSGLGLAIVAAIAERHGGSVAVDGPRFTIELPALRGVSGSGRTTGVVVPTESQESSPDVPLHPR